jgi:phenylalanine-4-hydroxylase
MAMIQQDYKSFTAEEQSTWKTLFCNLVENRKSMAVPEFASGLDYLEMSAEKIPDLSRVNELLKKKTGWVGVPVEGLEDGKSFFKGLAEKKFPIGNFIRDAKDVNYTPAPDIFHDLYGHIPFYVDKEYADYCQAFGAMACKYADDPKKLVMLERFFWFTIEFALLETPAGRRIFGAGILSSDGESKYSLSADPEVVPFSVATICEQDYRIDVFQKKLFVLKSREQLYCSISEVEKYISSH